MKRTLKIRDLTLRDGQQSKFATRMTQAQIDRVLPFYREAHFYAMEVWGGAVPDSIMRYLDESPWERLKKIKGAIGDVSQLTALSRGRNLFGYAPYPDRIIEGFCKNSIQSGLGIMRIFDALNDVDNVKSTIRYVKQYGGVADCAVCYTIDPKYTSRKLRRDAVFTDAYFMDKAHSLQALGADLITLKDMSGLITPTRTGALISQFKENLHVPIDFHTHCTPGYGLASVLMAIIHGVDIVDTNIWYFSGGSAAPALELIYLFCKKLDIDVEVNMEAVARINQELYMIRKELQAFDNDATFPIPFNPLQDELPKQIDRFFDKAIRAAIKGRERKLLKYCHAIEAYFQFPTPNLQVKKAEVPGGMYSNMIAQLKQLQALDILDQSLDLIPEVRLAAGLPPLVTPTSQIVGAQAVICALNRKAGRPLYANASNQFKAMVAGAYGKTPIPVDPTFREQITGSRDETPFDEASYTPHDHSLARNEQEALLLELFPMVAAQFLQKRAASVAAKKPESSPVSDTVKSPTPTPTPVDRRVKTYRCPMPGTVQQVLVQAGVELHVDTPLVILESMKMENRLLAEESGTVEKVLVQPGAFVQEGTPLLEYTI